MNKTLAIVVEEAANSFAVSCLKIEPGSQFFLSNKPYLTYWTNATTASLFWLGAYI
mgnify:CR=1 FL=1